MKSQLEKIEDEMKETTSFAEAFAELQKEMKQAALDSDNPHFQSKFSSFRALKLAAKPSLEKWGFIVYPSTLFNSDAGGWVFRTVLKHIETEETIHFDLPLIGITDMQKLGSATTYAERYGFQSLLGMIEEGKSNRDDDGHIASKSIFTAPASVTKTSPKSWHPEFMFTFGKHKGKTFNDIAYEDLEGYIQFLKRPDPKKTSEENQKNYKYNEVIFKAFDTWKLGMKAIGAAPKEEEPPPPSDEDYSDIPL